jgi:hypothetical protein
MADPRGDSGGGGMAGRAMHDIDRQFQEAQHFQLLEHQRQERRLLAYHRGRLESFADNRATAEQRYIQRMRSIEERRDRIADRMHAQHNSLGGRLARLTKAGRERQAGELERLNERATQLQGRATRNFNALTERQFQAEQRDRISRAHEIKLFRQDNLDARQAQAKAHAQNRPRQIEERAQTLKRTEAEQALRQGLQELQHGRGRTIAR